MMENRQKIRENGKNHWKIRRKMGKMKEITRIITNDSEKSLEK